MRTENGRKSRAKSVEVAKSLARTFVCMTCGEKAQIKSKQFGEEVECDVCHNTMLEVKED